MPNDFNDAYWYIQEAVVADRIWELHEQGLSDRQIAVKLVWPNRSIDGWAPAAVTQLVSATLLRYDRDQATDSQQAAEERADAKVGI